MEAGYYQELLRSVFAGRKVIVAADVLAGATPTVNSLRGAGADPLLVIAGEPGTGEAPDVEYVLLKTGGSTMMDGIRAFENSLLNIPHLAREAMDRVDPKREALMITSFLSPNGTVGARRVYGGRPPSWIALEDKVVIDDFFDRAGIDRAPSAVVSVHDLRDALTRFDRGMGVACAGDAKEGFNGGAEYVRWIRGSEDLEGALAFYTEHCDFVRVMPFLEGIPCSIHGMVVGEDVIAFRPVEMISLRRPGPKLLYAGTATFWDPPANDREYMRDVARRAGAQLRSELDYRGAFTVDGVLTEEGFRPTELNPRVGAGLGPVAGSSGFSISLLNKAIVEREALEYRPKELEELIVNGADEKRSGSSYAVLPGEPWPEQTHPVAEESGAYRRARDGEERCAELSLGPSGVGRFVRFAPVPEKVAVGPSFAPIAVRAFAFTDMEFDTAIGPVEAAKSLR